METTIGGLIAGKAVPPWLPRNAQDARMFAYWAQIFFLLIALIWFVLGLIQIGFGIAHESAGTLMGGFVMLIIAVVCGIAGIFLKKSVIDDIDHGRFHDAKNGCIIWGIVGIAALILPMILLLLAYLKLSEILSPQAPQYAPYSPGAAVAQQYPQQQPQQPQAAPQQQPPAAEPTPPPVHPHAKDQKYEMMKCKNCGVQFPLFMANCPNCGAPKA